jgi:hypothetical protein
MGDRPMMKFVSCLMLTCAAFASPVAAQQITASAGAPKSGQTSPFVPAGFAPPKLVETARFKLVPFSPALVDVDFKAYMSSTEHLQRTFSRSTNWPREGITHADAMKDMENEQARFTSGRSFDYSVLAPDGSRELGSVYISPSRVAGYDAVVRIWVTKDQYDAGFDAELYAWVSNWVQTAWPFEKVAYPGRAIDWQTWDRLAAAK